MKKKNQVILKYGGRFYTRQRYLSMLLIKENKTYKEVAELDGKTERQIKYEANEVYGIEKRSHPRYKGLRLKEKEKDKKEIIKVLKEGKTRKEIAPLFDMKYYAFLKYCRRLGL